MSEAKYCLHLQLYRDSKDRYKQGQTKASLSLQHFLGVQSDRKQRYRSTINSFSSFKQIYYYGRFQALRQMQKTRTGVMRGWVVALAPITTLALSEERGNSVIIMVQDEVLFIKSNSAGFHQTCQQAT
ncbi:Protein Dok-7 [Homalodisca vitripennis]|nr:Protein Dok-7 [Homalodisca vitripennis]